MLPKSLFASEAEYVAYLRDYFAGQAAIGLLSGQYNNTSRGNLSEVPAEAFLIADAMLIERSKATEGGE